MEKSCHVKLGGTYDDGTSDRKFFEMQEGIGRKRTYGVDTDVDILIFERFGVAGGRKAQEW